MADPSVLVIDRSAVDPRLSVSVDELFAALGSVTPLGAAIVAVLTSDPVADALMVAVSVNVAVPPDSKLVVVLMFPDPEAAAHVEPAEAAHVQVAPVSEAGSVSEMVAPVTPDGPAFAAVIV